MDPFPQAREASGVSPAHDTAHVLLDALSAFAGGALPGTHQGDQQDAAISLALGRLSEIDAVRVTLDADGRPRVDVAPLLRAALILLTSTTTMLEAEGPGVDQFRLLNRLRAVVDLTLTD